MTNDTLITSLAPVGKFILFTFNEEMWNGTISNKTDWGFEYQVSTAGTTQPARWGRAHAVGDEVTMVKPGQYILIDPLMWTEYQMYEDRKIWWTDETQVICATDEAPVE